MEAMFAPPTIGVRQPKPCRRSSFLIVTFFRCCSCVWFYSCPVVDFLLIHVFIFAFFVLCTTHVSCLIRGQASTSSGEKCTVTIGHYNSSNSKDNKLNIMTMKHHYRNLPSSHARGRCCVLRVHQSSLPMTHHYKTRF